MTRVLRQCDGELARGKVVAYLPSDDGTDLGVWRILYDEVDVEEDLDKAKLDAAIACYAESQNKGKRTKKTPFTITSSSPAGFTCQGSCGLMDKAPPS